MPIIPGLNEDCATLVLDCLETPSLLSIALTSRAAVHPVHLRLVHDPRLTTSGRASSFLKFVIGRSLESALHILRFNINAAQRADPWPTLLADVLQRATNLSRLAVLLSSTVTGPGYCDRIFDACQQRFFDALVNLTPALKHLRICQCNPEDLMALQGIQGLRSIWLSTSVYDTEPEMMASNMASIKRIIAGNANTLQDVSLVCPNSKGVQLRFEGTCPLVTRFAFFQVPIDFTSLSRAFPNIRRLKQEYDAPEDLGASPVLPELTTLVTTDALSQPILAGAHSDYPLLRCLIIINIHRYYSSTWFSSLLQTIKRFYIHELSLRDVAVPPGFFDQPSEVKTNPIATFLSQLLEGAPHLRKLDLCLTYEYEEAQVDSVVSVFLYDVRVLINHVLDGDSARLCRARTRTRESRILVAFYGLVLGKPSVSEKPGGIRQSLVHRLSTFGPSADVTGDSGVQMDAALEDRQRRPPAQCGDPAV
ncbi:hypothetical protein DENSPDRAFT_447452 [Dentipellis sp. KUC8613]|nr:hypothetical protein DENSPDRAFT_447452 [Dentipellis sp. KUC8613]